MILYHGTQNDFKEFKHEFIGEHATGEGKGFYFTDSESLAKSYANGKGFLVKANVEFSDSMSLTEKTITLKQFTDFLRELDSTGQGYLSNWGDVSFYGYDTVLNKAASAEYNYSDNDTDLISGIINAGGHTIRDIYNLVKELFNWDCIIVNNWAKQDCKVFVIFQPEQIKIISKEDV